MAHFGPKHLSPFRKSFSPTLLHFLHLSCIINFYTLLGFFGLGPLCGIGVTSLIALISIPFAANVLIPDSLPAPTPFITTSTSLIPTFMALSAKNSAILAEANGVPFLAPLKPKAPLLEANRALPLLSVSVISVLL